MLGPTQPPGLLRPAAVPLQLLLCPAGAFELSDPSGDPAGHIEVMLRWESAYLPPPSSVHAPGETGGADQPEEELRSPEEEWAKGDPGSTPQPDEAPQVVPDNRGSTFRRSPEPLRLPQVPQAKPRQRTQPKEARKVTFVDAGTAQEPRQAQASEEDTQTSPPQVGSSSPPGRPPGTAVEFADA